jgi:hypothetical protein
MGATMAQVFGSMIPFFCIIYAMSILIFSDVLSGSNEIIVGLIAFIGTLVYFFLPIRYFINKCRKEVWRHDDMTYEKNFEYFLTDYNRSNPMSEKQANIAFIEKLKESGKLKEEQYQQHFNYYQQGSRFSGVMQYGAQFNNLQNRVISTYQPAFVPGGQGYAMPMVQNQFRVMPQRYVVRLNNQGMFQNPAGPAYYRPVVAVSRAQFIPRGQQPGVIQYRPGVTPVIQQPAYIPPGSTNSNVQPPLYSTNNSQGYARPQQPQYYQPQPQYVRPTYQPQPAGYQANAPGYVARNQPVYNPGAAYINPQPQYYQATATVPTNPRVADKSGSSAESVDEEN